MSCIDCLNYSAGLHSYRLKTVAAWSPTAFEDQQHDCLCCFTRVHNSLQCNTCITGPAVTHSPGHAVRRHASNVQQPPCATVPATVHLPHCYRRQVISTCKHVAAPGS